MAPSWSADLLRVPKLTELLRALRAILDLHPIAQSELEDRGAAHLQRLFSARFGERNGHRRGMHVPEGIVSG